MDYDCAERHQLIERLRKIIKVMQNLAVKNAFIGYESEVGCP